MKIISIGAGPAALYFGILIRERFPTWEVTLLERNALGDTFGWGVVFSDETLSHLLEADPPTHLKITDSFAHWDAIDVHARGETFRSAGHGFSGIARRRLLEILEERALELGVTIEHGVDITDPERVRALAAECDLLLGADGLRSIVRTTWRDEFRPSFDVRKCRYLWLGTPKLFEAFTFAFAECEHGMFQAHAYRFDERMSTFIAECDEETFARSGLADAPIAETVAYLEKLFAPWLDGQPLLINRSQWIQFVTVRNERWHRGNVVLLGDAAHTAHFSIGSGTKLALEDAIALADSFTLEGTLDEVLDRYEQDRRPVVERTQKAAHDSLVWFEQARRYRPLPPWQFAFSLLTRSKRITYENLGRRDRAFADDVARRFAASAGVAVSPADAPPPPMFTPFTLRGMTLANRVVVSSMCMYSAAGGLPGDFHLVHYGALAQGGAGLVMTEMTDVSAEARITLGCAGIYTDEHTAAWRRIVDFAHAQSGARVGLQLGHAGRKGATRLMWEGIDEPLAEGAWEIIAPSALPYFPHSQTPRPMDRADMDRVIAQYAAATRRAVAAGFDLIEIHMAHGYLLASFLSPLTNLRSDGYGGSIEGRARFPLEVFDAVRALWPAERPMSVRVSATDWHPHGITDDDLRALAAMLKERGCDIIDVSSGQTVPDGKPVYGRMFQTPWSDLVRNEVGIATMAVGNIQSADQVNSILASGRADLCVLARPHLADPFWTLRAAAAQGWDDQRWPVQYAAGRSTLGRG
nr:bifunctional salicylyl-CoA 5-hydroxylase/oxidoreductase [Deltaproteobacteria bacterium]